MFDRATLDQLLARADPVFGYERGESAMGSVSDMGFSSPARLDDSRDIAAKGKTAEDKAGTISNLDKSARSADSRLPSGS